MSRYSLNAWIKPHLKHSIFVQGDLSITCANLKIFFFLSMIFKVPFWKKTIHMKFKFALPIHQRTLRVISLLKVFNSASSFEKGRKNKFERGRKEEKIYEKMNYYHAIKLLTFLIPIPFTVSVTLSEHLPPATVRCLRCGAIRLYPEPPPSSLGLCSNPGTHWVLWYTPVVSNQHQIKIISQICCMYSNICTVHWKIEK